MSEFFTDENRIAISTRFDSTPRFVEEAIRMRFEDASAEKIIKLFKKLTQTTTHSSRIISWNGQNRILGKGECIFTKKGLAAELDASPASISFWLKVLEAIVPFSTEVSRNRKSGGTILKWIDYDMVFRPFEWIEKQKLKKNLALQHTQKVASELELNSKRTPTELEVNSSALEPQGLKEGWRTHTELILNSKRDTNKTSKIDKINNLNTTLSTNTVPTPKPEKSWLKASESLGEEERELIKLFNSSFPKIKVTQKQAVDFVSLLHSQNPPKEEVKELITSARQDILLSALITSLNGLLYYDLRKQEVAEVSKGVRIKLEQFNDSEKPANFETAETQAYRYFLDKLNSVPARKHKIKWTISQFRAYYETQIQQAKQDFDANQARLKSGIGPAVDAEPKNPKIQAQQPIQQATTTSPGEVPTTGKLVANDDRPPCPGNVKDYEWVENDYDLFGGEWKKIRKYVEPRNATQKAHTPPSMDSIEKIKEEVQEKQKPLESNSEAQSRVILKRLLGHQGERIELGKKSLPNSLGKKGIGKSPHYLSKNGQNLISIGRNVEEKDHQNRAYAKTQFGGRMSVCKFDSPNYNEPLEICQPEKNLTSPEPAIPACSEDRPSSEFFIEEVDCSRPEGELGSTSQQDGFAETLAHVYDAITEKPKQEKSHQETVSQLPKLNLEGEKCCYSGNDIFFGSSIGNKGHQKHFLFQSHQSLGDPEIHSKVREGATPTQFGQQLSYIGLNAIPIEPSRPKNSLDAMGWNEPKQKPNLSSLIKELSANVTPPKKRTKPMKSASAKAFANKHRQCRSTFENFGGPQ